MPYPQHLPLHQLFAQRILQVEQLEKLSAKKYVQLAKAAHTDELAKCLNPESTDIPAHQQRISLIKKLIPKTEKPEIQHPLSPFQVKSKGSLNQDLILIEYALQVQNQKLALYELLHPIAVALGLETVPSLIEQTISDNRNTNTWLRQIIQNIISPQLTDNENQPIKS
ncbi:DUF892 family protein [Pedobacter sp. UC225_61]|uniref:DUF892 family protein n=1 Tax=Pedobacter sp. UC225_61 TaxID=3374623 RepID=UPI003799BC8B